MGILREWLLHMTAAAIFIAVAETLMPEGTVRRIGRLSGGLLLMIAMLSTVLNMEFSAFSEYFSQYRNDLGEYRAQPETANFYVMKTIIEAESGAYIQDKAAQLGILCQAEVCCTAEDTKSYPYPVSAKISGVFSQEEICKLQKLIEAELAIPAEQQTYSGKGGDFR